MRKGKHNYCAVLVNLGTQELLRILEKRTKEALKEELMSWGEEVLANIKEVSIDLWHAYEKVVLKIGNWLKKVTKLFTESSKTIRNWIGEIISYFDNRTTNGIVEVINNKLKLIKRIAYGFRNFDNFCTRVFLDWNFQY